MGQCQIDKHTCSFSDHGKTSWEEGSKKIDIRKSDNWQLSKFDKMKFSGIKRATNAKPKKHEQNYLKAHHNQTA
jgi:hypothetical protein